MTLTKCVRSIAFAIVGALAAAGCSAGDDSAAPSDAGVDAKTARDGAPPPSGNGSDGGLTCAPNDETSFIPKWHAPNPKSSACTMAQVLAYHQCLTDQQSNPTAPSCAPFGSGASDANKACLACMISLDTAPTYGPLVVHNKTTYELNVAGCIALATSDPQGKGCAGNYQASQACTNDACSANCAGASIAALDACRASAASGTCNAWYQKTSCVNGLLDAGGDVAVCFQGATLDERFDLIVPAFCVGAADSGTTDASAPPDASASDAGGADAGEGSDASNDASLDAPSDG